MIAQPERNVHNRFRGVAIGVAMLLLSTAAQAQRVTPLDARAEIFAGSELEGYLRTLQLTGKVPLYPWSLRGFSPREVERLLPSDSLHPWAARLTRTAEAPPRFGLLRPDLRVYYNSAFPFGEKDGPVWAGKGATTALQVGAYGRAGPLSFMLAPTVFRAENGDFPIYPNGYTDQRRFGFFRGVGIDYPQRFGDGPYARLDPGNSFLRVDASIFAAEVSTSGQAWGPGHAFPIILSGDAPGFPRLSLGSSRPVDVGIGRLHGKILWGRLSPTKYALAPADSQVRFAAGISGVFTPRGLDALELGFARFFHAPWPDGGLADAPFGLPVEALLKNKFPNSGEGATPRVTNQLASVFARWTLPRAGAEVYFEYAREDHNFNTRDLILELDHSSAYMVGIQKAWGRADRLSALRVEFLNARPSNIEAVRHQGFFYTHVNALGHAQRGQILGSPAALGGGGAAIAFDRYARAGRWSFKLDRQMRADLTEWDKSPTTLPRAVDVLYSAGAERSVFWGGSDFHAGVTGAYNLNRNFEDDEFNLNLTVGARVGL